MATTSVPLLRRMGNSASRWMNLRRKSLEQRQVDLGLGQIDELQADFFAQGPQRLLLAEEAQFDGGLVEPRALGLRKARGFELSSIQEAAFVENLACFHTFVPRTKGPSYGRHQTTIIHSNRVAGWK